MSYNYQFSEFQQYQGQYLSRNRSYYSLQTLPHKSKALHHARTNAFLNNNAQAKRIFNQYQNIRKAIYNHNADDKELTDISYHLPKAISHTFISEQQAVHQYNQIKNIPNEPYHPLYHILEIQKKLEATSPINKGISAGSAKIEIKSNKRPKNLYNNLHSSSNLMSLKYSNKKPKAKLLREFQQRQFNYELKQLSGIKNIDKMLPSCIHEYQNNFKHITLRPSFNKNKIRLNRLCRQNYEEKINIKKEQNLSQIMMKGIIEHGHFRNQYRKFQTSNSQSRCGQRSISQSNNN